MQFAIKFSQLEDVQSKCILCIPFFIALLMKVQQINFICVQNYQVVCGGGLSEARFRSKLPNIFFLYV